ncbi:MAG: teichoic acid biosynthesis protein [Myxococcota bacterium]|jgi:uncharacterized protein (TIGR00661 family)|nr:teichoic acid biosynthesis protein [Myxococcota bacterium]
MKLLYGVVGEGMGHAMRSTVVLEHLLKEGHEVAIVASSRAVDTLAKRFSGVHRIAGFHIVVEENRVRRGATLWSNIQEGRAALPEQIHAYFELIRQFEPEAVVSDFESWSYLYGKTHRLPVLSIDNMQIINRCRHDEDMACADEQAYVIAKTFIKAKLPHCDHYFITTFFYPEIRKKRTTLHSPILRPEILAAQPRQGSHLLVYQTSEGYGALLDALKRSNLECRVYGLRRDISEDLRDDNVLYRPFSETTFIDDLACAKGVVAGGGFTTMGECVHLGKPLLCVPIAGQFEQVLNGRYLRSLGYGHDAPAIDANVLQRFIADIPRCQDRLSTYQRQGNEPLMRAIDEQLDKSAAGLR